MGVNPGFLVALLAVPMSSVVDLSYGASIPSTPTTHITIRVLSAQQKLPGYGRTSGCLYLANLQEFVVHGPDDSVDQFCILMYRKASDCQGRPLQYDFVIMSSNLTQARNLPPVQAIKRCSTQQLEE